MGDPAVGRSVPPLRARLNLKRRSLLHWLGTESMVSMGSSARPRRGGGDLLRSEHGGYAGTRSGPASNSIQVFQHAIRRAYR